MLAVLAAAFTLHAEEKLPFLKVGADIYTNVTITVVTRTEIYFTSDSGLGNAKLKNLDRELQAHFHFDAAAAAVNAGKNAAAGPPAQRSPATATSDAATIDHSNAQAVMNDAIAKVKAIVNQPVRQLARTPEMTDISLSSPGWFHEGATKPEFDTIDVTETQQAIYDKQEYAMSDLNPDVVFIGKELAFNAETKYFYTDRSLPKKKLTRAELLEINRLYRIIGKCEAELDPARRSDPPILSVAFFSRHKSQVIIAMSALLVVALGLRMLTRSRETT